ncbi:MAG: signal peptidase I [Alphaproteobacteria bacterium]|nr:signal peptidase I [Alphaproteobacteria bacterium]MBV9370290.1 signal peptidase I [Alphaproteobacteria bacterium]MBV9899775.1 signal peptidase I [Alphaproteobacteria bacterium]
MASAAKPRRQAKAKGGLAETTRFLLFLFVFTLFLRTFIIAPFMIPSGSMLPRLMIGDYLFVAKWPYGYSRYAMPFGLGRFEGRYLAGEPERGDIVVFRYPGKDEDWVKRLIGLPGDKVQMRAGQLFLNGRPVTRVRIADFRMPRSANSPCRYVGNYRPAPATDGDGDFCPYPRFRETLPNGRSYDVLDQIHGIADDTPVYTVPAGHYFMMGDNRDDSADSRFTLADQGVGFLPRDNLIGRPVVTFFSTDGSAEWLKPWTWFSAMRWERIGRTF